jgi:hypothetical protein
MTTLPIWMASGLGIVGLGCSAYLRWRHGGMAWPNASLISLAALALLALGLWAFGLWLQ